MRHSAQLMGKKIEPYIMNKHESSKPTYFIVNLVQEMTLFRSMSQKRASVGVNVCPRETKSPEVQFIEHEWILRYCKVSRGAKIIWVFS